MSDFKFTVRPESSTFRSVFEREQYSFPVLLQVTQGHHGDIDLDTYSTGHIMRIHTYSKQRRVVAKDVKGRQLSIPVNYKIKFRLSNSFKKAGKEYMLREIVENNTLPVKVDLCTPPPGYSLHVRQNIKNIEFFGELNLLHTYEETYLLANSIVEGLMDAEVLFVPIYLKSIDVSLISGIEGRTESGYQKFLDQMNRWADTIHFDTSGGNDDIAVYSSDSITSENVYDYIQPQHFIKFRETYNRSRPSMPMLLNVQEITERFENKPPILPKQTSTKPWTYENPYSSDPTTNTEKAPPLPKRVAAPKPVDHSPSMTDTNQHHYVNNVAWATVKPLEKASKPISGSGSSSRTSSAKKVVINKNMADIKFTVRPEGLTLMEVFERYQHSFPVLLQVIQGHHGETDFDTYSTGHIMRIHTHFKQRRVMAESGEGTKLSIPVNFEMIFRLRDGKECYMLRRILDEYTLPVKVDFADINLIRTYDETYLLANSIVEGTLDDKVLSVPVYLKSIIVSMITGIEGRTESEYQKFLEQLNQSADAIHFDTSGGNDDVIFPSDYDVGIYDSEDGHDYIIPRQLSKNRETRNCRSSIHRLLNTQEMDTEKAPPLPKRMAAPKPHEHHNYVNTVALATVKPLEKASNPTSGSGSSSRPSSAEGVGSSTCFVKGLSINQLAERLESLNLGKYSQTFKDAQICGDLLMDLDETVLRDDFGMKRYEAIKLMKYARTGFVPK